MNQIFISHNRRDKDIRQYFDTIFAITNVKSVRMEFEELQTTPSMDIIDMIMQSNAIFVLLAPNLTFSKYTKNWVVCSNDCLY